MKKLSFLFALLLYCSGAAFAQIGFNNDGSQPDPSAGLDIKFSDKGLLIPRVSLTSTSDVTTIPNAASSLLVFNTTMSGDVFPGIYTWFFGAWRKFAIVGEGQPSWGNYLPKWSSNSIGILSASQIYETGSNIGIGTTSPGAKLDVNGSFKFTDGNQGANKVLTSDANGLASWQTPATGSSGWSLSGNAGTSPDINFIGTTDPAALDFRTNNILRLRINTRGVVETWNTGNSVFFGWGAGMSDDLTDNKNVFIGYQAGSGNSSGAQNTAVGATSLYFNGAGSGNTVIGYSANVGPNIDNATAIGNQAFAGVSNSLVLGGTGPFAVNVGIGNPNPTEKLDVVGGNIKTNFSFISTVEQGTPPLLVYSTTRVDYFNADMLDGQDATGFIQNQTAFDQVAGLRITGNALFNGGSVGIGTATPNESAALDITSNSKGFLMPRMTSAQISNIFEPGDGMAVYNTTDGYVYIYSAPLASWKQLSYGPGAITPPATCGLINDTRDGKTYHTIQIGSQCWMQENLDVGTYILSSSSQTDNSMIEKYCYQDVAANCATYGGMYQWDEMMQYTTTPSTQGICPDGWHIPSSGEWDVLKSYLSTVPAFWCNSAYTQTGKSLASTTLWATSTGTCDVGNDPSLNNATHFTGLPVGRVFYYPEYNYLLWSGFSEEADWWSSSESSGNATVQSLMFNASFPPSWPFSKQTGIAIRCVKN